MTSLELPTDISALHDLIRELLSVNAAQQSRIEVLEEEVKELRAQLGSNSSNSHRPPSSDGYGKKPALPRGKKYKRGGRQGHKGATLEMVSEPDHEIDLRPSVCSCGQDLSELPHEALYARQVFDLPEPKLEVSQYQLYGCQCPSCGAKCAGKFPSGVSAPVQYGSGVKALSVLLNNSFNLPYGKIEQLFADLYGYSINASTLCQANAIAYEALAESEAIIQDRLCQEQVVHVDESGLRIGGKLQWLHSLSSQKLTHLFVHPNRGKEALESEYSLLPRLTNWLVHDCWASYFPFTNVRHALCGAHILRELQALIDRGSHWASQMHKLLIDLYHKTQKGTKALARIRPFQQRFDRICYQADLEEPPPIKGKRGKPKKSKGRNLLERLIKYQQAVFAFAIHPEVPFTNNLAERDIRPIKVKLKVAGCFRTNKGAQQYARIQAFISTARKNQRNSFKELKNALSGNTFLTQGDGT